MKARRYLSLSLAVVLCDQLIKICTKLNMSPGQEYLLLGDWIKLYFIENNGFAFGLTLADIFARIGISLSAETSKFILTGFSLFAVVLLVVVLIKYARHHSRLPFFIALIVGGAIGNIIDRVFYGLVFGSLNTYPGGFFQGQVVDMFLIDMGANSYASPIFNLADAAIAIGIVAILLFQGRFMRTHENALAKSEV